MLRSRGRGTACGLLCVWEGSDSSTGEIWERAVKKVVMSGRREREG